MRVVVVTSEHLSAAKSAIIDGLECRLVGIACVPTMPEQTRAWRHIRALAVYAGPRRLPTMFLHALASRLKRIYRRTSDMAQRTADSRGVAFLAVQTLQDPKLHAWIRELRCDLVVSLQSHRVPASLLAAPRLGWLNLHHGRIPDYRGVFSVFWAMSNREPLLYITAHLMGVAFDCGPVIVEAPVSVPEGASVEAMEKEMWKRSPEVVLRAVERLEEGSIPNVRWPEKGRYYTYPTWSDVRRALSHGLRVH
jgi:folate-dependent phosphoribosylglycinamide formyltransferase PurN